MVPSLSCVPARPGPRGCVPALRSTVWAHGHKGLAHEPAYVHTALVEACRCLPARTVLFAVTKAFLKALRQERLAQASLVRISATVRHGARWLQACSVCGSQGIAPRCVSHVLPVAVSHPCSALRRRWPRSSVHTFLRGVHGR
jgi:hypothetical protein